MYTYIRPYQYNGVYILPNTTGVRCGVCAVCAAYLGSVVHDGAHIVLYAHVVNVDTVRDGELRPRPVVDVLVVDTDVVVSVFAQVLVPEAERVTYLVKNETHLWAIIRKYSHVYV